MVLLRPRARSQSPSVDSGLGYQNLRRLGFRPGLWGTPGNSFGDLAASQTNQVKFAWRGIDWEHHVRVTCC